MSERRLPPVTALGMLSLGLVLVAGIYLAAHLPKGVPIGPAVALLCASAVVLAVNVFMLSRVEGFAWRRFFQVARWALLAYAVIAAMIEYVFLRNKTSGSPLVVLTCSLIIFAVNVPLLIAFTVARYEHSEATIGVRARRRLRGCSPDAQAARNRPWIDCDSRDDL